MRRILRSDVYRVIDANLNRSREGLRVCEDIARFVLNSHSISSSLKRARHSISSIVRTRSCGIEELCRSRDVTSDVGKEQLPFSEIKRTGALDIFLANIQRTKESVRVLEEFYKIIDKPISKRLSSIRFMVYDIEKQAVERLAKRQNSK